MKYLNVRIDDVYFNDFCLQTEICESIQTVISPTCGVVLYRKEGDAFIKCSNSKKFFETFSGAELALHGLCHEGDQETFEFQKWTSALRFKYDFPLGEGKKVLNTTVFIPPHNYFDHRWRKDLIRHGFKVVSSSKRDFSEVIIDGEKKYPVGVIKNGGIVYVPQTCFVKKKDFYAVEDYFLKLAKRIEEYYKIVDIVVLTIHWWDFISDEIIDKKFLNDFLTFIKSLLSVCQTISLEDAQHLNTQGYIVADFFDWTLRNEIFD